MNTRNMFADKYYKASHYKCVGNIEFLPKNTIKFTLTDEINNQMGSRLDVLRSAFHELSKVDCHGLNHPMEKGLRLHWFVMTFPRDMPMNEVKTWFYFILGDREKTKEFASECEGKIFQIEKPKLKFHSSTQFHLSIRELSFAKQHVVTFKTVVVEQDLCVSLHNRINTLKKHEPRIGLIRYIEGKLEKSFGLLSLRPYIMIFPEDMSASEVKKFFYYIVGDEANFIKEEEQSNQRNPTQNNPSNISNDKTLLNALSQLANTNCGGLPQILKRLNNQQNQENNDLSNATRKRGTPVEEEENSHKRTKTTDFAIDDLSLLSIPSTLFDPDPSQVQGSSKENNGYDPFLPYARFLEDPSDKSELSDAESMNNNNNNIKHRK